MSIKEKVKQLKNDIPAVFLALKEKETPWYAKMLAAITVTYALSPIDPVPDFIPVLGYLDDIVILPLLVTLTIKCIPKDVLVQCREQAEGMWENGKPKKWYYAMPVIAMWCVILLLILKFIFD